MTSEEASPWARPSDGDATDAPPSWAPPGPSAGTRPGASTSTRPASAFQPRQQRAAYAPPPRGDEMTGPGGSGDRPPKPPRPTTPLVPFLVGGGALLALGLVVVLVLVGSGFFGSAERRSPLLGGENNQPSKPPLAKLCPPASTDPDPGAEAQPPAAGPRLADPDSGISYLRLGAPWQPWDRGAWGSGTLGVRYRTGYYFVTETYSKGSYLASVLSGKVPATVGDSLTLNLECAGRQVAEDVRRSYYPQPNVKEQVRDERVVVGGRPAWVATFHLKFSESGLAAKGESVAVVLVDVGRPDAAVLYISIPETHKQLVPQIDQVIASIAPA